LIVNNSQGLYTKNNKQLIGEEFKNSLCRSVFVKTWEYIYQENEDILSNIIIGCHIKFNKKSLNTILETGEATRHVITLL